MSKLLNATSIDQFQYDKTHAANKRHKKTITIDDATDEMVNIINAETDKE